MIFFLGWAQSVLAKERRAGQEPELGLPKEIERFVHDHIESLEELEILLLLRANKEKPWTGEAVAQELRRDPKMSLDRLVDLERRGFVASSRRAPNAFLYAVNAADMDGALKVLADLYPRYRNSVVALIVSKPTERVQSFPHSAISRSDHEK